MITAIYTKDLESSFEHKTWEQSKSQTNSDVQDAIAALQGVNPDQLEFVPRPLGGESFIVRIQEEGTDALYCFTSASFPEGVDPLMSAIREQGQLIDDRQADTFERTVLGIRKAEASEP